jgi:tol-pal system protein YbgF
VDTYAVQRRLLCTLLLGFVVSGCAVFRMPDQLTETQQQIRDLEYRIARLSEQIAALEELQQDEEAFLREMRASQSTRLDELERRVAALEELLRYSTERFDRASRDIGKISERPVVPVVGLQAGAGADTVRVEVMEGEQLYDSAYSYMLQGRYPLAVKGFSEYLARFPSGDLADNCQYGIGESYYAQSEFATAADAFLAVVSRYPDSDNVPSALLKAGFSFAELGDTPQARTFLNRVIDDYPYSDEAIKARDRLSRF